VVFEVMTGPNIPWEYLHHIYYFLPKLRRVAAGEFTTTMNGDSPCVFNPLARHGIYVEVNMTGIT